MSTLNVGVGQTYTTIAAAVAAAHGGDTVLVQAGTYTNDFFTIKTDLTLKSVGGMVDLVATKAPSNGKAIAVVGKSGTNVTIDGFAFSGAKVADGNGAGIRYEGGTLTIRNAYFHDNQDGLLGGTDLAGRITITNTEFAHNGSGDGRTHNLYVGDIAQLNISNSYFHDAVVGHEIKSRAENTVITNSRIVDGSGTASYSIDLPNGGNATITGNVIEQGINTQNPAIIAYGEEGSLHAGRTVLISGNTIVNDHKSSSDRAVWNATTGSSVTLQNNKVYGLTAAQLVRGTVTVSGTTTLTARPAISTAHPWSLAGAVAQAQSSSDLLPAGTVAGTGNGPATTTTTTTPSVSGSVAATLNDAPVTLAVTQALESR